MRPVVFSNCFGWIHDAHGDSGIVLCGALGFEQLCAHTGLVRLADMLAARGYPVLRFDYHGVGDSAGDHRDPDRLNVWRANVAEAVGLLRARTGVTKIYLAGLRFGALMALDHATQVGGVDGLILLAPPSSGRAYLREQAAFASLSGSRAIAPDGAVETIGFRLSAETMASIRDLSPAAPGRAVAGRVFVATDPNRGLPQDVAGALRSDATVEIVALEGADEWLSEPTLSRPPLAAFERLADWLGDRASLALPGDPPAPDEAILRFDGLVEEPLRFGPNGRLFGMLCRAETCNARSATIIVNSGANPHVGWARSGVEMSRALAAQGRAVLRMDVAGLGDSPAVEGRPEIVPYAAGNVGDVQAAMYRLQDLGFTEFTLAGSCSGGNLAIHAALADTRVRSIVAVNVLSYHWRENADLRAAMRLTGRSTRAYGQRALKAGSWRRLVKGDVDAARIVRALSARGMKLAGSGLSVLNPGSTTSLVRKWFAALGERRVKILLVFSEGDQSIDEFRMHLGERRLARFPGARILILPDADHNLTSAGARDRLVAAMVGTKHENDIENRLFADATCG